MLVERLESGAQPRKFLAIHYGSGTAFTDDGIALFGATFEGECQPAYGPWVEAIGGSPPSMTMDPRPPRASPRGRGKPVQLLASAHEQVRIASHSA